MEKMKGFILTTPSRTIPYKNEADREKELTNLPRVGLK